MFTRLHTQKETPRTRSLILILLAWTFIGGQALLAAGSMYDLHRADANANAEDSTMPWQFFGQGATRVRLLAVQAHPATLSNVAIFLAVANTLGLAALMCALLSWSRSRHRSGRLTIAAAVAIILVNSLLNLPYA